MALAKKKTDASKPWASFQLSATKVLQDFFLNGHGV
jgi:hypothetical protein